MATKQRYPLSTFNGQAIPLDVLRPSSVIRKDFLSASATAIENLPAGSELLLLRASASCFIRFSTVDIAVKPVSATPSVAISDSLFLEAGDIVCVSPLAQSYSVIGDTADGTLDIQVLETWLSLSQTVQTSHL